MMTTRSKKSKLPKKPSFLAVDFFCGAGGTTRGLIDAGGYVIAGIDKDEKCRQTYVDNNVNRTLDKKKPIYLERDVFPFTDDYEEGEQHLLSDELEKLLKKSRKAAKGVPLLFAICAPCQPFTKLSKKELSEARKAGRAKDRDLLLEACKFVEKFQPELILSENVAGIKSPRYGGIWDVFRKRLNELGYKTGSEVVCTSKFGIPQHRKRSILVGIRNDLLKNSEVEEIHIPVSDPKAKTVSVKEALSHLPPLEAGAVHPAIPNHKTRTLSELNLRRLSAAKPGESNAYMEKTKFGDLSLECHRKVNKKLKVRCFTDVYTRMHPDRPSPTITTRCHSISNGRFGHYDTKQLRGISLREAAILQSFPDNYVFYPENRIEPVARMIGNAVPPKLARFFAKYLVDLIKAA